MGQVLQAGAGQLTARQAARAAGVPMSVPGHDHQQGVPVGPQRDPSRRSDDRAGEAEIVVAGGMESMTNAPYLLANARGGYRYGNGELLDVIQHDGLYCALEKELMGEGTERYAASAADRPRRPGCGRGCVSTSGRPGPSRTACSPTRSCRSRSPNVGASPIVFSEDEGVRPGHRPRQSRRAPACLRRERATSRRATPRRSPTGPRSPSSRRRRWPSASGVRAVGRARRVRPGRRARHEPAAPNRRERSSTALAGGVARRGRHRSLRDQRGLRCGVGGVDGRPGHRRRQSSTSTVAPSRSGTPSAPRATAWHSPSRMSCAAEAAARCGRAVRWRRPGRRPGPSCRC